MPPRYGTAVQISAVQTVEVNQQDAVTIVLDFAVTAGRFFIEDADAVIQAAADSQRVSLANGEDLAGFSSCDDFDFSLHGWSE
jgi:hypothetical protein